jgi:hypothetical protein
MRINTMYSRNVVWHAYRHTTCFSPLVLTNRGKHVYHLFYQILVSKVLVQ